MILSSFFFPFLKYSIDSSSDRTIGILLFSAFKSRYKEVLTKAHTTSHASSTKILARLTKEEVDCELNLWMNLFGFYVSLLKSDLSDMTVYESAQSSMVAFKKWRIGGPRFHRASMLGIKRKPANWWNISDVIQVYHDLEIGVMDATPTVYCVLFILYNKQSKTQIRNHNN